MEHIDWVDHARRDGNSGSVLVTEATKTEFALRKSRRSSPRGKSMVASTSKIEGTSRGEGGGEKGGSMPSTRPRSEQILLSMTRAQCLDQAWSVRQTDHLEISGRSAENKCARVKAVFEQKKEKSKDRTSRHKTLTLVALGNEGIMYRTSKVKENTMLLRIVI